MDLEAANLADGKALRLTRASMLACFVIASVMLIASLAMAHGTKSNVTNNLVAPTTSLH